MIPATTMGSDQSKITASANDATTATPATAAAKNGATAAVDGTTKKSDGTHWDPYSYFSPSINFPQDGPGPFALLILNQPIFNKSIFLNLWRKGMQSPQWGLSTSPSCDTH